MALMPRVIPYGVFSASTFNAVAQELENQGRGCKARRTSPMMLDSGLRTPVPFQVEDFDTNGGGMWDASANNYISIPIAGTYLMIGQVRWDDLGGSGSSYRAGMRNAYITVDSTDPSGTSTYGTNSINAGNSLNGEGQTLQVVARAALQPGDRVYLIISQDCGFAIAGCHQNFGGTFLDVSRLSAIA